ncbi:class I SAM-dependent methyltransferase [Candidatus Thioglobus sp.]|jgi:ubiquinone/menaquinone biosynthesis C-methylase UbiE|nr:class I SAM-dependent methyltransferase [Candidatus Thioglobus sp.]|tara:strand:- start:30 stop:815 length:786 start_codon:yes stop_codon:yes gene_type:complete
MKTLDKYTSTNRKHWNEVASVHQEKYVNNLLKLIADENFTTFDFVEKKLFQQIQLSGKSVAQVNCNNARELISVKRAGASRCVGFDISDEFIKQGETLKQAAGVDIELVCTDIYELGNAFDKQFDLLYITIGVLGWLQDLEAFFRILSRLLKPGGQIFIYEMHPILELFEEDSGGTIRNDYFNKEPYFTENENDYMNPDEVIESPSYWFHHPLSKIFQSLIAEGFKMIHFDEYAHDISGRGEFLAEQEKRPPMCFSLIASR